MKVFRPSAGRAWVMVWAVLGLAGCASPGSERAPLPLTPAASLGLQDAPSAAVAADWWSAWGDPQLDTLMRRALEEHPTIALARARVERAQALARVREAAAAPQATLGADLVRQRYSESGMMPAPLAGSVRDTATVRASLAWAPDIFGQQAADLAAALGLARAAQADAALAATGLTSQIGRTYIALARWLAHRALALRLLAQREQAVALVRARVQAGLDSQVELTQAQGSVPEVRHQLAVLDEQIALARHQLAVLSAQPAAALDSLSPVMARLAIEAAPRSLGTDLLGRRPDVVAARWRVESALQDVGLARMQFYPNLNLGAFIGLNSLGLGRLLRAGSIEAGVAPALRLPLFDGDRLRQQLGARRAELDAAIAQYNATLLDAVREAGDALQSDTALAQQQLAQDGVRESAERALDLARQRHAAGLVNALAVLQAKAALLAQQRQDIDQRARALDNRVLLLRALGGGWRDDALATDAAALTPLMPPAP